MQDFWSINWKQGQC